MKIAASVTFVHTLVVLATIYIQPAAPKIVPRQALTVKTFITQESVQLAQVTQPPPFVSEPEVDASITQNEIVQKVILPLIEPTPALPPTLPTPPTPQAEPTPPAVPTHKADPPARGGPPLPNNVAPPRTPPHSHQMAAAKKPPVKQTSKQTFKQISPPLKPNHDKLISMVQKSLNTLNSTSGGKASPASGKAAGSKTVGTSKTIGPLASEALTFEARYEQELVSYLEALFSFPEKGDVKVKLTLKREGNVQNVEILKASSQKNREYVTTSLASCSFPAFGTHFKGEAVHTFTLNLTSE